MRVNILQLRTFYAIAMEGSFSQAARRLNLSQSTLSKQLKAFEDRHQISIFNGRTPPLKLTPAGEALMASVKSLFSTIEDIEGLLGDHDAPERSIVRLAADTPSTGAGLANVLKAAFPQSGLQVRIENARDSFELFRSGTGRPGGYLRPTCPSAVPVCPRHRGPPGRGHGQDPSPG